MSFLGNIVGGLLGGIDGQTGAQNAANSASASANAASGAQNQLIQQGLLPIYNQELNSYNQNYAPYQAGLGQQIAGLAGAGGGAGQTGANAINAYQNVDSTTGINQQGNTGQDLSYLTNPQNTNLSHLYAPAQQSLGQSLGNLQQQTGIDQQTVGQSAGNLANTNANLSSQLNPNNSATTQVGANATMPFYLNEMQNGLSRGSIGAAENNYLTGSQQAINSDRNQLGAGAANPMGMISQLGEQQLLGQANLASSLAGQNQGVQQQGAAGAFNTAQGMDTNTQNMLGMQGNLANTTNNAMMGAANANNSFATGMNNAVGHTADQMLGNAAGLDSQTAGMLGSAVQTGGQQQQQQLTDLANAYGISLQGLQELMGYTGQGNNLLSGAANGLTGISNMYGQAASGAAQVAGQNQQQANGAFGNFVSNIAPFFGKH